MVVDQPGLNCSGVLGCESKVLSAVKIYGK